MKIDLPKETDPAVVARTLRSLSAWQDAKQMLFMVCATACVLVWSVRCG